jgi:bifunctional diaminopimelate decarboxylase / aspartate kinase
VGRGDEAGSRRLEGGAPRGRRLSPDSRLPTSDFFYTLRAMTRDDGPRWVVMKFGGKSVSTAHHWKTIAAQIRERQQEGLRPFVVCGAIRRVTRLLNEAIQRAASGEAEPLLQQIAAIHDELGDALGLDESHAIVAEEIDELERLVGRIEFSHEVSPAIRARILAAGELMVTKVGSAFLEREGLEPASLDAREVLRSVDSFDTTMRRRYLVAECDAAPDPALQKSLRRRDAGVVLTQGFIAGNRDGETVLLGWGGSDKSAACFAAKLEAERMELWSDVPGIFTADPHRVPSARLLRVLDYEEAQELASTGAEVIYPGAIEPLRNAGVPLHIRSINQPDVDRTVIGAQQSPGQQVKAISVRRGITLISVDTVLMWHQVGFLARLFEVLARHDLSIDLVATAETNVTVTIDPIGEGEPATIEAALEELGGLGNARQIPSCAVISLVGRDLRSILPDLAPAFEVMEEQRVHLVSQSASDLDFSFVVDERHADRIVAKLHARFFDHRLPDETLGSTWRELSEGVERVELRGWWQERRDELLEIAHRRAPVYVYDEESIHAAVSRLRSLDGVDRIFYAMKANSNPEVLRVLHELGTGFECVSENEIALIRQLFPDLEQDRILFTPNFAPEGEYAAAFEAGTWVTLDNLHPIASWPALFAGKEILVRIDPGKGHGHHSHVRTAGAQSKFGIVPAEIPHLRELAASAGATIIGLHAHVGSGVREPETWRDLALFLMSLVDEFSDVRIINVGGGLGVPERPGDRPLDIGQLNEQFAELRRELGGLELWMEPGRYLVAESGVLLARVTQLKSKGTVSYVGIETGMNSLIRPALYGAYHEILNLSRLGEPATMIAEVVGPICETGDVLGHGRRLPPSTEGDVILIATTGAYGRSMSSEYNLRKPAEEELLPARKRAE